MKQLLLLTFFFISNFVYSQPGRIDTTFNNVKLNRGANSGVESILEYPDGKILIGGRFTAYNDTTHYHIVRLLPSGNIDPTFKLEGSGFNNIVFNLAFQSDGKIIVTGVFDKFNDVNVGRIVRLLPDGKLDSTFASGLGANGAILTLHLSNDNIFIGGDFTEYNSYQVNKFCKLSLNGEIDLSYLQNFSSGFDSVVYVINEDKFGRIYIGGDFRKFDGIDINGIARIKTNGEIDIDWKILNTGGTVTAINFGKDNDNLLYFVGNFDNTIAAVYDLTDDNLIFSPSFSFIERNFYYYLSTLNDGGFYVVGTRNFKAKQDSNDSLFQQIFQYNSDFELIKKTLPTYSDLNYFFTTQNEEVFIGRTNGILYKFSKDMTNKLEFNGITGIKGFNDYIPKDLIKLSNDYQLVIPYPELSTYNDSEIGYGFIIDTNGVLISVLNSLDFFEYLNVNYQHLWDNFPIKQRITTIDTFIYGVNNNHLAKYNWHGKLIKVLYQMPDSIRESYNNNLTLKSFNNELYLQLENKILKFKDEVLVNENLIVFNQNTNIRNLKYFDISVDGASMYFYVRNENPDTTMEIYKYSTDGNVDLNFSPIIYNYTGFNLFKFDHRFIYTSEFKNNFSENVILRYSLDGNLDTTFNKIIIDDVISDFEIDLNDNLLIGNSAYPLVIKRYNKIGILDSTFFSETLYGNGFISDFELTNTGDIIVVGFLPFHNNLQIGHILKLHGEPRLDCNNLELHLKKLNHVKCNEQGYAIFNVEGGIAPLTFTLNDTTAISNLDTLWFNKKGYYAFKVEDATGCVQKLTFYIGGDNYNADEYDLSINFVSETLVRGFDAYAWINVVNQSCKSKDAIISFTLPSNVQLVSAYPAPSQSNGNTYKWNISDIKDSTKILLTIRPTTFNNIGDEKIFMLNVDPTQGDVRPENNNRTYKFLVSGSYDPNDINNNPKGECATNLTLNNERITYTIRFQNIGDSPARNVYVLDSLSPFFDFNSLNVLSASHDMIIIKHRDDVLRFDFPDINLPAISADSIGSIGYFVFEVALNNNVPLGTMIKNKADIYFDFNEPVITNEVFNTIVDHIPMYISNVTEELCQGETFILGDIEIENDTSFSLQLISFEGCDSIVNYSIDFHDINDSIYLDGTELIVQAGYETYIWEYCSLAEVVNNFGNTFTPVESGFYGVTIIDNNCAVMSDCIYVTITDTKDEDISNKLLVYPNPSIENQGFNIHFNQVPNDVSVINSIGLTTGTVIKISEKNYQLNNLNSGFYYLVADVNGCLIKKKIIVVR